MNPRKHNWKARLATYKPDPRFQHDEHTHRVCKLALKANELYTYGVGAMLLANDKVLIQGHNQVNIGRFRSDLHAEMVILNKYERRLKRSPSPTEVTLFTSLEPCMMCAGRIVLSEIAQVLYVANDVEGGMVTRLGQMPPLFQKLSAHYQQQWKQAECSEELRSMAHDIWNESRLSIDPSI